MPRNRQQIPKAERQAAVVARARDLFAEKGYRGTSMAEVGRSVGIAAAAVHWYFPTKDDLFAAVVDDLFNGVRAQVEADPSLAGDPREELVALLTESQRFRALHREAYERIEESEALRAVYATMQDALEGRLLAAISSRLPEGADVALIADAAHVLFEGLLISVRRLDRPLEDVLDLLIDALAAAASAKSVAGSSPD
ncbi:AcrR family transcriptional regulator [Rhodococcus sp. LBL1]|nr:AcrR family transcriptional regulator [Rhodococcus sp. LBL1]MDH6684496.1 AcrR family transcriptional regulator [Rhodococcus sp. LBL2]